MLLRSKRKLPEIDSDGDSDRCRDSRRLKLEPSSSKSIPQSHKSDVLKLLNDKNESNRLTCELRMSLFMAAAQDPDRETLLHPFPPCFTNSKTKCKDYKGVTSAIDKIPALANITKSIALPELTWELLSWILTNPVINLEPLVADIPAKIRKLIRTMKLVNLKIPNNSDSYMFKITQTNPKPEFADAKKKYGTKFGFHGSSVKNFHSIIHRGLMCSFNVISAHGHGTYMSLREAVSNGYAQSSPGWTNSLFGNTFRCIVIVEFAMSPDTKDFNNVGGPYVCDNDDHMQLSHLIVYRQ